MQKVRIVWTDPSSGTDNDQLFTLPVAIGRSPNNALVLPNSTVSGTHAVISFEEQQLVVLDSNSSNGTFINGTRQTRAAVQFGDIIQIGSFQLILRPEREEVAAAATAGLILEWSDPTSGAAQRLEPTAANLPITIGREPGNTIVLTSTQVSRRHARIVQDGNQFIVIDQQSGNGVLLNGQRVEQAALSNGDTIQIGPATIRVTLSGATGQGAATDEPPTLIIGDRNEETVLVSAGGTAEILKHKAAPPAGSAAHQATAGSTPPPVEHQPVNREQNPNWPPAAFANQLVSMRALEGSGLPIVVTDYAAIGGGLGSFIWADTLLIYGVPRDRIIALGLDPVPYSRYERLCRNSQIPRHERLRSNSESCPDNIWGWPGYGLRESWGELSRGNLGRAFGTLWQIAGEPSLNDTYTPRSGDVFASIDREARRIGWRRIFRYGRVRAIRKTDDGRYVIAFSQRHPSAPPDLPPHAMVVARYIQIATGYPALRFLPDLQEYRIQYGDFHSVVNAYEEHDHVYRHLESEGGLVLLRGRGIVASRIIQRIYEARAINKNIGIVHLMRSRVNEGHRYGKAQRQVDNHFEFQPFNWPRACWSGDLRKLLERAKPSERQKLLKIWGGTTTADRQDWVDIVRSGLRDGWYKIDFGKVTRVERDEQGNLITLVCESGEAGGETRYKTDFIIDATGLEAEAQINPLLGDLIDHYQLQLNPMKRLHVEPDFEIPGLRNGPGRAYAAGAITLGGPSAPVDSFLGLQYCAQRTVDSLARLGAPGVRHLNGLSSLLQWLKWAQGVQP